MSDIKLEFGLKSQIPDGVKAAWGARAILSQGYVDFLHDRMSSAGEAGEVARLIKAVNRVFPKLRKLGPDFAGSEDRDVIVHEDDKLIVFANPKRSYGYLYFLAYFKP